VTEKGGKNNTWTKARPRGRYSPRVPKWFLNASLSRRSFH